MSTEVLLALWTFAFVSIGTPGPNNVMLLASCANFGLRRTLPHILGINIGILGMLLVVGLGVGALVLAAPGAVLALKTVSIGYLVWLAWKIAHAAPPGEADANGRPMTPLAAAAFQLVNPKAWAMVLGAVTAYAPGHDLAAVAVVLVAFASLGLPRNMAWTMLGGAVRRLLSSPARLRAFNWSMAGLLLASLWPALNH
jgi:threonine/homoserine/homoserine lactone efflux protein